ncbi:ATP-binding protein [Streptomyces avermitilis]|uniref:ATP-binding protein n=1 Tax=Streptomyces avermitilis TaxID=33903 RepID=UPI00381E9DF9
MYATSLIDSPAPQTTAGGATGPAHHQDAPQPQVPSTAATAIATTAVEGTWPLEHRPEAAADARRITRTCLDAWHIDPDGEDAVLLVVSELVTNAVEHAQAPVHLHLHRTEAGSRIWIGVSDAGPAERDGAWTRSCAPNEHGRGLNVVKALAEHHGTHTWQGTGHTTHWARINTAAA